MLSRIRALRLGALAWMTALAGWSGASLAVAPPTANPDAPSIAVTLLPDTEDRFTAAEVLDSSRDAISQPVHVGSHNLGYPHHPYWVVLAVRNPGARSLTRELVLWRGAAHRQTAFERVDGEVNPLAYDVRTTRHAVLQLELQPNQLRRLAVRIDSTTALSIDYRLLEPNALADIDRVDYWFFGMLAGIVFAIALYVVAIYFAVRDRLYLYFAAFAVCNLIYQLHFEAYAYILWGEDLRWAGTMTAAYSGGLFSIFLVLFIREFVALPRHLPRLDRWVIQPGIGLVLSVIPLFPISPWLGNTVVALSVSVMALVACIAVLLCSTRVKPIWSLVFGVILFSLSGVVHLLRRIGWLADTQSLNLLLQLGSAVLVISFAIAVMVRIRRIVTENQEGHARYARQLEEEVSERTTELRRAKDAAERALSSLQETQQQLVQSEKMASLGQLVAGVAHEVNTPLGVALTASTFLEERAHAVHGHMQAGKLTRVELNDFLGETEHSAEMIERNLTRAAHLVSTFKQVSVDRTSDGRRLFRLDEYIRDLVESLELTWKRRPIQLEVTCPQDIQMDSFPGALGQVLTNLIQNALLHAYPNDRGGIMRIAVVRVSTDRVQLVFTDDGEGVPADQLPRIFDPFYTTRRNMGGTGLGLHVTWNLVVQKLGGSLRAESAPGRGLLLAIELPRVAPAGTA